MHHQPLNPEQHGDACWDCHRHLGARVTVAWRGLDEEGRPSYFALCARCAKGEALEIETGKVSLRTSIIRLFKRKK
jgi:hypothetical protein